MKRRVLCLALILLFLLSGCAKQTPPAAENAPDVDLTALNSTMVYSQVYNMMKKPSDFVGKTVRMQGVVSVYTDKKTGNTYYSCIVKDATACCQQGMEFVLREGKYPAEGAEVTVFGTFETYLEGKKLYCHLADSELENG